MKRAILLAAVMAMGASCTGSENAVEPTTTVPPTTTAPTTPTTEAMLFEAPEVPELDVLQGFELVSSISAGKLLDNIRTDATDIGMAIDRSGDGPDADRPIERRFTGVEEDVVVVPIGSQESDRLNPAGAQFAFQAVGVVFDDAEFDAIARADIRLSWNVMQRGLAGNNGGQWKMSVVNESDGSVNAQCVVRDEENRLIRVNSSVGLEANTPSTLTCIFDDRTNQLRVDVDGVTDSTSGVVRKNINGVETIVYDRLVGVLDEAFGDSNPSDGGMCGGDLPEKIGNVMTFGNKPACGSALTDDDRFQGTITAVQLWKRDT